LKTIHKQLREQLQTAASSLTRSNSRYGEEVRAVLSQPDDASPRELHAHADRLKQIEDSLESA
jgi:peptidase E